MAMSSASQASSVLRWSAIDGQQAIDPISEGDAARRPRRAPADDLAGGHVLDRGQVQPALAGRDVADIGQPDGIGVIGSKVPPQQVRHHRIVMPAVGCVWNTTPDLDPKPACPHQPFNPLAADLDTLGAQLGMHAWTAISPPARGKDRPDPLAHPAVLLVVASWAAAQP